MEEETPGDHLPEGSKEGEASTGTRVPGAEWRVHGVVLVQPQGPQRPLARNPEAGVGCDFPLQARAPVPARHLGRPARTGVQDRMATSLMGPPPSQGSAGAMGTSPGTPSSAARVGCRWGHV